MNKIIRREKTTILIGAEGDDDYALCQHLKTIYCSRDLNINIDIFNTHGGSPRQTVHKTKQRKDARQFHYAYAITDSDRDDLQAAIDYAVKESIELIMLEPVCLEGMLLNSLGEKAPLTAPKCKSRLRMQCGDGIFKQATLAQHFPENKLDKMRLKVPALNQLIEVFTIKA